MRRQGAPEVDTEVFKWRMNKDYNYRKRVTLAEGDAEEAQPDNEGTPQMTAPGPARENRLPISNLLNPEDDEQR